MRRPDRRILFPVLVAALLFGARPLMSGATAQSTSVKVVHAGRLIDGTSATVKTNVSIIMENDRIREVRDGRASLPGAEVIDLSAYTVMPGLIDCHTHLTMQIGPNQMVSSLILRPADHAINATVFAEKTLMAGFTTVRDVGAGSFVDISLRNAINAGTIPGPRMHVATQGLSITGGHGDVGGIREDLLPEPDFREGIVNGSEEAVRGVRYAAKYGADWIKISATGGVLSLADASLEQHFTLEEMKTIVETAKMLGLKVAAHAHGGKGIKAAIRAGVASIEHGTYLDDEAIQLFKQRGTYLVPTIIAGKTVEAAAKIPGYFPPMIAEKAKRVGPIMQGSFGRAYKGGVKIAFGTDAGVFPHGQNAKELEYMVEAGMPPIAALLSAMKGAADLLGESEHIGSVQAGRYADLVAVKGDPVADIKLMQNVAFVMKGGVVHKRD